MGGSMVLSIYQSVSGGGKYKLHSTIFIIILLMILYVMQPHSALAQRNTKRHIIITFDISGSMATKYISSDAHERMINYLFIILTKGIYQTDLNSSDEIITGLNDLLVKEPLLNDMSVWSVVEY